MKDWWWSSGSSLLSQALAAQFDPVCVVDDPIEDGVSQGGITDHLMMPRKLIGKSLRSEVIDPCHPLYGSCLPVIDRRSGRGPDLIVVRLADGRERSIQRSATDLAFAPAGSIQATNRRMHISVRTLLPLANHIRAVLASRHEDFESRPVSDRTPARPEHGGRERIASGPAAPVAPAPGRGAVATGTADRSTSATPAPGVRSGDGETSC